MAGKQGHMMKSINAISRCAGLYRGQKLKEVGIAGWQEPYLPVIGDNPGITQDQLAAKLHVDRSNVARQLARLEENGFVARSRCAADRRAVEVRLTEKGEQALPLIWQTRVEWRRELLAELTEEEQVQLEELLAKLAVRAEELV